VKPTPFREPARVDASHGNLTLVMTTCEFLDPVSRKQWWTRCYNGTIPGPTIHMQPGTVINITVQNALRNNSYKPIALDNPNYVLHLFDNINESLHKQGINLTHEEALHDIRQGTGSLFGYVNDTNLHPHGLVVGANKPSDDVLFSIKPGEHFDYSYPIPSWHASGTHWYHPHRHHATTHQAHGGAFGAIIVDDLPGDLPLACAGMAEKLLNINVLNVSMWHTIGILSMDDLSKGADGVNSELAMVNGQPWSEINIKEGVWYRFRIVFASNIRALRLSPFSWNGAQCQLRLIAKDGIYINDAPREVSKILLASGNRADVLVGCKCTKGRKCSATFASNLNLPEWMLADNPKSLGADASWKRTFLGPVFSVKIQRPWFKSKTGTRLPFLPRLKLKNWPPCYLASLTQVPQNKVVNHTLEFKYNHSDNSLWGKYATGGPQGMFTSLIGGSFSLIWDNSTPIRFLHEDQPASGTIKMGTVQQWTLLSPGPLYHPFHQHVQPFQIANVHVDTALTDAWLTLAPAWTPYIKETLATVSEWYKEGDWHDTLMTAAVGLLANNTALNIAIRFIPLLGPTNIVMHCHWLQHEDQGMMLYLNSTGTESEAIKFAEGITGCSNDWRQRSR